MERLTNYNLSSNMGSSIFTFRLVSFKAMRFFGIFFAMILLTGSLSGCASITRMQNSMEQMTYYMGVVASSMPQMAFSTKRMADTADGLQHKSDGIMSEFQKKGAVTEKAVQNYAQTFIDNERAVIKNLQGIKQELADLKQTQPKIGPGELSSKNQEKINAAIMERVGKLEAQIQTLVSKLNKTSESGTSPSR